MRIIGIDPGSKGAVALIDTDKREFCAFNLPVRKRVKASRTTTELDAKALHAILERMGPVDEIWIEDVHSMSTDGHVGAFSFGMNKGALVACVDLLSCNVEGNRGKYIHPSVWKPALNVTADKNKTKQTARLLFREAKNATSNEGKCEALLIALYGVLQHTSPSWPMTDVTDQMRAS
ncbi:MAG: hypothetical protein KJP02_05690 [Octadecabacter sp.]|nr:hypothetical protein [Octadecabacter sp.]